MQPDMFSRGFRLRSTDDPYRQMLIDLAEMSTCGRWPAEQKSNPAHKHVGQRANVERA